MTAYDLSIALLLAVGSALILRTMITRRRAGRLPPGPPGELLLGNARHIPPESSWLYYMSLKKYGQSSFSIVRTASS